MKPATDKQLKLIIEIEMWLSAYKSGLDTLDHSSEIGIGDASKWISEHIGEYKELRKHYTYADLIKQLNW